MFRKLSLVLVVLALSACEYDRRVEMPTVVSSQMSITDTLDIRINGILQDTILYKNIPSHRYTPKVLVRSRYRSITAPHNIYRGYVNVEAYSRELGCVSKIKRRYTSNDQVAVFQFNPRDFPRSCRHITLDAFLSIHSSSRSAR